MSRSGIGIIRVSGDEAIEITAKLFPKLKQMKSHTIRYGFLVEEEKVLDEVLVSLMKSPHSYTREDVVEINCHGGVAVMNKIMEALISKGARLAEPGEFTKRAFLNGRIDLTQADAVMDLINARNTFALENSLRQLRGAVSQEIKAIRSEILRQTAHIEAALDDPEHYDLDGYNSILREKVAIILARLEHLQKTAGQGRLLKEGINTVIVGKPNVGKSSFLNLLLGEERAIVTDIAGTTRDTLSESAMVGEVMLNIIDTAGIRKSTEANTIEQLGIERSLKALDEAGLVVFLLDRAVDIGEDDWRIAELVREKRVIVLINKIDLPAKAEENELRDIVNRIYPQVDKNVENPLIIQTSTKEGLGLEKFAEAIKELYGQVDDNEEIYLTNLRHIEALNEASESMRQVQKSMNEKMPEDFLTIDLMDAYASLGRILGEEVGDDLIASIFAEFCLGK
jgi:tRNA modification GTPase